MATYTNMTGIGTKFDRTFYNQIANNFEYFKQSLDSTNASVTTDVATLTAALTDEDSDWSVE